MSVLSSQFKIPSNHGNCQNSYHLLHTQDRPIPTTPPSSIPNALFYLETTCTRSKENSVFHVANSMSLSSSDSEYCDRSFQSTFDFSAVFLGSQKMFIPYTYSWPQCMIIMRPSTPMALLNLFASVQRPQRRWVSAVRFTLSKGKGRFAGPIQHCSLMADCTLAPEIVPSFISRGAPHQAA
jgi:hypothetical protein